MKKIKVYCGETVQDKCGKQRHPVVEVRNANNIITSEGVDIAYSNDSDFISAMKYIGIKQKVDVEFFLNGVSCGNDIEPIFGDLNRSLDLIHELGESQ